MAASNPPRSVRLLRQGACSVLAHRLRAALSVLGVTCGVVSFVLLVCVSEGAQRDTLARIGQLGMRNVLVRASPLDPEQAREARMRGSHGLNRADGRHLAEAIPGISSVGLIREVRGAAEAGRHGKPMIAAVTPEFVRLAGVTVVAGRAIAPDDVKLRSTVCIVGEDAARRLGREGQVGGSLRIEGAIFRIVGIVRRGGAAGSPGSTAATRDFDNAILVPLGAESGFAPAGDEVSEIVVEFREADAILPSLPALRRTLAIAHHGVEDTEIVAPQELLQQASQAQRNFLVLTGSIALVAMITGGIGIMNTMLAAVSERTREIGVRRAVGATRRDILLQFVAESVILTAAGALAGLALGLAAALAVSAVAGWPVTISIWSLVLPAGAALLAGVFFGGYPALLAARMDPVEALRHP